MEVTVVLEPQDEGGYTASVPSLPGCVSEGVTKEEAINNIRVLLQLYLDPDKDEVLLVPLAKLPEAS